VEANQRQGALAVLEMTAAKKSVVGTADSSRLGSFRAHATNNNRTVVLRYGDKTIVVTPDNPDTFVRELSEAGPTA